MKLQIQWGILEILGGQGGGNWKTPSPQKKLGNPSRVVGRKSEQTLRGKIRGQKHNSKRPVKKRLGQRVGGGFKNLRDEEKTSRRGKISNNSRQLRSDALKKRATGKTRWGRPNTIRRGNVAGVGRPGVGKKANVRIQKTVIGGRTTRGGRPPWVGKRSGGSERGRSPTQRNETWNTC